MAWTGVSTTKSAHAALRYGEHEESVIRGGVDCPPDTEMACRLFTADRIMWNKDNGVQAHIIVQSFDGRECTPEEANKMGQELAKQVAPGHRAMVYTHQESEGGNIHNHIVICAVNHENGKKLDGHGLLYHARNQSDELCKERGLSIIDDERKKQTEIRYTMAEKAVMEKGGRSWKDEIREAVESGAKRCNNISEFTDHLASRGITIRERGKDGNKSWTYYTEHEGKQVRVRAAKLGEPYSRDNVTKALSREKVSALDKANELIKDKLTKEHAKDKAMEPRHKSKSVTMEMGFSR